VNLAITIWGQARATDRRRREVKRGLFGGGGERIKEEERQDSGELAKIGKYLGERRPCRGERKPPFKKRGGESRVWGGNQLSEGKHLKEFEGEIAGRLRTIRGKAPGQWKRRAKTASTWGGCASLKCRDDLRFWETWHEKREILWVQPTPGQDT